MHFPVHGMCFSVDKCRSYCVENQKSSHCIASPQNSTSDHISLTSSEDLIHANCCSAGTPVPFVSWELCKSNSTGCTSLTNAAQPVAELKLAGNDLPAGDRFVRCIAKYLDVTEGVWTISVHVEKADDGKT